MNRAILLIALLLTTAAADAQFSDTVSYFASYASTGSVNKTNDGDSYLLNNAVKFSVRKKRISLNTVNGWVYGKQNRSLTNNDFSSSLDFNVYDKQQPRFYYWGLANYNTSYSLKINNQLLTGAGLACNLVDRPDMLLNISDGILYDRSDLYRNDTIRDQYHTFRNSLRVLFRISVKNMLVFDGSAFIQNSLKDGDDYIIRSATSMSLKLKKWLSFTTALSYNRVSRTDRENMLLSYGLTLEKYF